MVAREQRLEVKVPTKEEDNPRYARVGVIAGVGFFIGMVWPWLAGVKLVPSVPSEDRLALPALPVDSASAGASALPPPPPLPILPKAAALPDAEPKRVKVGKATVKSCKNAQGETLSDCDLLNLDPVAAPKLEALQSCKGSETATGVLSLGLRVSFDKKKVKVLPGKSTSLPDDIAKTLLECAKKEFENVSLDSVAHNHPEYTVFYLAELSPRTETATEEQAVDGAGETTAMNGSATVSWVAAIVRDQPKREGKEVARLLSGTKVAVTGHQSTWYRVKYNSRGDEGWVFKSAIGM